jgi:hypothetical protein
LAGTLLDINKTNIKYYQLASIAKVKEERFLKDF